MKYPPLMPRIGSDLIGGIHSYVHTIAEVKSVTHVVSAISLALSVWMNDGSKLVKSVDETPSLNSCAQEINEDIKIYNTPSILIKIKDKSYISVIGGSNGNILHLTNMNNFHDVSIFTMESTVGLQTAGRYYFSHAVALDKPYILYRSTLSNGEVHLGLITYRGFSLSYECQLRS